MEEDSNTLQLNKGDILFKHGDPGGDLFHIVSGDVEIYREKDSTHITLSFMHPGEIIGLLTCIDKRPRTASARAAGKVSVKKIPSENITKTFNTVPDWFQTILKEYSIRIHGTLDILLEQSEELENAKNERVDLTYHAQLLCASISSLANYHKIDTDRGPHVLLPPLLEQLSECLCLAEERIDNIINVLHDAGLIKMEKDPDRKQFIVPIEIATSISDMTQFILDSRLGLPKKQVNHTYMDKSIRIARAMVIYASKQGNETKKEVTLNFEDLEANLENKTGTKFIEDALEDLDKLKLLAVNEKETTFIPTHLGRTISKIVAYQKLKNFKEKED